MRKKRKNLYSTRKRRKISHPEKVPGASNVDGREWYLMEAAAKKMVDAAKKVDDECSNSKCLAKLLVPYLVFCHQVMNTGKHYAELRLPQKEW